MSQSGSRVPSSAPSPPPESDSATPRKDDAVLEAAKADLRQLGSVKSVGFASSVVSREDSKNWKKVEYDAASPSNSASSSPAASGASSDLRQVARAAERIEDGGLLKTLTSLWYGIPFGFFNSRADLRIWGEESPTDPSVQPTSGRPHAWNPFQATLPGYSSSAYFPLQQELQRRPVPYYSLAPKGGIVLQPSKPNMDFPRVKIEEPAPPPLDVFFQPPTYNWKTQPDYKMLNLPYPNAMMTRRDPAAMYAPGNGFVAYPYGVPAVEENEVADLPILAPRRLKFLCCG